MGSSNSLCFLTEEGEDHNIVNGLEDAKISETFYQIAEALINQIFSIQAFHPLVVDIPLFCCPQQIPHISTMLVPNYSITIAIL